MGKYGLKIKNFQAGSIYEYNLGVRDIYDYTDAMLPNSLFLDYLMTLKKFDAYVNPSEKENDDFKEPKYTRDIVCIEFDYGSRSYEEEDSHINKLLKNIGYQKDDFKWFSDNIIDTQSDDINTELIINYKSKNVISDFKDNENKLLKLKAKAYKKRILYSKMSKDEIRTHFYTDGIEITYITTKKNGDLKSKKTIKYKMLYRTPGKAKKGSCMFINEKLYKDVRNFLYMGIKLPKKNSPIVEIGAYSSLITSSIVDRIRIKPEEILVLNDVDSTFNTNIVSVELDKNKHCIAVDKENAELKNTLFDGQALIDSSIFPDFGEGYILLRHHLCKMAAFNSNIQLFFKNYYGDAYSTATVNDMWGNPVKVSDIKLITTDNAMKWLKFKVSYEYWSEWVRKNDCMFGIVKTAHESKLGEVQRMSYQMINSLDIDIMDNVTQKSVDYINKLKQDDKAFIDYLRKNKNFSNDFEVLVALYEQDNTFAQSEYFRDRKKNIIQAYVLNFKNGRVIQNADNLVIVGSPYAMLLHAVGEDVEEDPTFNKENGTIQCYTERFNDGEYLAEFRSPFNSKNNMGYLHNVYHPFMKKYFNFGKQIIAVNMIHTDFQDRNNGSDQDSDSIYTTNQPDIVECAKQCYAKYPTIVNNIPMEKNSYEYTLENFAKIDNNLAAAQAAIGESSNLAQLCLTYTYNAQGTVLNIYNKFVCILSVLAQVAIDNAKRRFDIDLNYEIKHIKSNMNIDQHKYPLFWTIIRPGFNKKADDISKEITKVKKNNDYIPEVVQYGLMSRGEYIKNLIKDYDKKNKISKSLKCPMNSIYNIKLERFNSTLPELPMQDFFVKFESDSNRRKSKKVEDLIEAYSLKLYSFNTDDGTDEDNMDDYLLLRSDFEDLIDDIKKIYLSNNYLGLFSWLINRAFCIGSGISRNQSSIKSTINTNKSLLLKTLYDINKDAVLKCFSKNVQNQ